MTPAVIVVRPRYLRVETSPTLALLAALGLGAALLTIASGVAAYLGKPLLLLQPPLLIVIGLYLIFRLLMSRAWFRPRGFLPPAEKSDQT